LDVYLYLIIHVLKGYSFSTGTNSLKNFIDRFALYGGGDREGAKIMERIIDDSYDKWTTNTYDLIQAKQQKVFYFEYNNKVNE